MAAVSNYGSTITFNAATLGDCQVIDFPEIMTDEIDTTNHASSGVGTKIPNGLYRLGDLTVSILSTAASTLTTINTAIANKTVAQTVVSNGVNTFTVASTFFKSAKAEPADATSPDAVKITAVIACSGALTLA